MYLTAEIGTTCNGSFDTGKQLIKVAKEVGADAVKFQIIRPEKLQKLMMGNHLYHTVDGAVSEDTVNMLTRLALEDSELLALAEFAKHRGLDVYSTADFVEDVDIVSAMHPKFHKICRQTWKYFPHKEELLSRMLRDQIPVIIDVEHLKFIPDIPRMKQIYVQYFPRAPYTISDVAITVESLKYTFNKVGYSCCDSNIQMPHKAKSKGAEFCEAILTLDKTTKSPDHLKGFEPDEFKKLAELK